MTKEINPFEGGNPRIGVRRHVLLRVLGLMVLGSPAAVSLGQLILTWAQTQSGSVRDNVNILSVMLRLEYQVIATYQVGTEDGLLQKSVLVTAVKFQGHYRAHASVLAGTVFKLGDTPVMEKGVAEYNFPASQLKTQTDALRFAAGLEKSTISAYLGVMPSFYTHDLVKAAVNILGDETVHWAVLLSVLGENPVPVTFVN